MKIPNKRSEEQIAADRAADRYIDLMEKVKEWCLPEKRNLRSTDKDIAIAIEKEFDIPANAILVEFEAEDSIDYTTAELIMRAYDKTYGKP